MKYSLKSSIKLSKRLKESLMARGSWHRLDVYGCHYWASNLPQCLTAPATPRLYAHCLILLGANWVFTIFGSSETAHTALTHALALTHSLETQELQMSQSNTLNP